MPLNFRWSEWRRVGSLCRIRRLVPAAIAHLAVGLADEDAA
jgi:hypothetical protein